jgi:hypothetical protein
MYACIHAVDLGMPIVAARMISSEEASSMIDAAGRISLS